MQHIALTWLTFMVSYLKIRHNLSTLWPRQDSSITITVNLSVTFTIRWLRLYWGFWVIILKQEGHGGPVKLTWGSWIKAVYFIMKGITEVQKLMSIPLNTNLVNW